MNSTDTIDRIRQIDTQLDQIKTCTELDLAERRIQHLVEQVLSVAKKLEEAHTTILAALAYHHLGEYHTAHAILRHNADKRQLGRIQTYRSPDGFWRAWLPEMTEEDGAVPGDAAIGTEEGEAIDLLLSRRMKE